ncbi:hypothetical protein BDR22DRAFT_895552 [Usnea florida]
MEHFLPLRILFTDERDRSYKIKRRLRERYVRADIKGESGYYDEAGQVIASKRWNANNYRSVGPFGNGLEQLYQIVSRLSPSSEESEDDEDSTDSRIFASATTDVEAQRNTSELQHQSQSRYASTSRTFDNRKEVDYTKFDEDCQFPEIPGTQVSSAPGTDKRLAVKEFERTTLVLSDEQIVNTCLEDLLMALSNVIGFYGRLLSERRAFVFPKDESSNLHQVCVDGLIMTANRQDIIAFIEVKRRLRSDNDSVYRQIGAQMAAFIRNRDYQQNTYR